MVFSVPVTCWRSMVRLLDGKLTLITGASSGIGQACAETFAQAGSRVILVARRAERLEEIARRIHEDFGIAALPCVCDVRSREQVQSTLGNLPRNGRMWIFSSTMLASLGDLLPSMTVRLKIGMK